MFSLDQYLAVRERAGLVDRSARGRIAVAGNDRSSFLHAMLTNDIASLQPGTGCYAALLTPQGRMIADMHVLQLGDLILLDVGPGVETVLIEKLDQFIFSEDVRLGDVTQAFAAYGIYGPQAGPIVARVCGRGNPEPAPILPADRFGRCREFENVRTRFGDEVVVVACSHEIGEPGLNLYIDRSHGEALGAALKDAGAEELSRETAEVLRVEGGRPAFPTDMGTDTTPLEAGIEERAISFTKGCYPGQEVITRVLHRGHGRVARKLVGLVFEGDTVPAAGDALYADVEEIGHLTSAVRSPALGKAIALGYLRSDWVKPGTAVAAAHDDRRIQATVTTLPFISRPA
jgi:folate-binding protein YgfZ